MTKLSEWRAALDKAAEVLGDVEPLAFSVSANDDKPTVQLRYEDFMRLCSGKKAERTDFQGMSHWKVDAIDFFLVGVQGIPVSPVEEVTLP